MRIGIKLTLPFLKGVADMKKKIEGVASSLMTTPVV